MLQKKKKNDLKYVMMLITTKTHNERGVFLHEYYSTGSTVSSTDSKVFAKAQRNRSKYTLQSEPYVDLSVESKIQRQMVEFEGTIAQTAPLSERTKR